MKRPVGSANSPPAFLQRERENEVGFGIRPTNDVTDAHKRVTHLGNDAD